MTADALNIFIVDDQPMFRLGLRTALEQTGGMAVLGECSLADEAVELVSSFQPHVALVGTEPPRHRGLDICRRITQRCPGMPVILMSPVEDSEELLEAIRSGAWAYVSKLGDTELLLQAIRRVAEGEIPLQDSLAAHPAVARRLLEEFQAMARNPRLQGVMTPLSSREMEILRQLGSGRSNKEIAHVLGIAPQTVKNHISAVLRKLDVYDRTQAVLAGLRYGWIALDGPPLTDRAAVLSPSRRS